MSYGYYLVALLLYLQGERRKSMNKYGFETRAITNYEKKIVSFIVLLLALNMFV